MFDVNGERKKETWTQVLGSVEQQAQRSQSVTGAHGSKVHDEEAYCCARELRLVLSFAFPPSWRASEELFG